LREKCSSSANVLNHRVERRLCQQVHWNAFRFCIGPVPDRWLQIADEAGLLIWNGCSVWVGISQGNEDFSKQYDLEEVTIEYAQWMRDNWKHPSLAV
jgi:beta-galactosidase